MGLKNTNYEINGYTYPEVYAVFNGNIKKRGECYYVYFDIHANRDLALHNTPLKTEYVIVSNWDRQEDLVSFAYHVGKEKKKVYNMNNETYEFEENLENNVFTGWIDDIVK